jgi:putative Mn2+ efflux pump MntP
MDMPTVMLIAVGLAMDCFAVSITNGILMKNTRINDALKIAMCFGLFQAGMPIIGWLAGLGVIEFISSFDHWTAFGLLCIIGGKMIYESTKIEPKKTEAEIQSISVLLMLSIATSIDALAVGLSFAFLRVAITIPIIVIGTVTFLLSFIGVFAGNRFGAFFGKRIETVSGLILIGIGIKILAEHLV